MDNVQDPPIANLTGMGGTPTPDVGTPQPAAPQVAATQPLDPQQQAQIAQVAHDSQFGRMAKAILGQSNNYSVGPDGTIQNNPTPQAPGSLFRTILGAAILGGAAGANGNSAQGFAGGFARGGAAAQQNAQQQDQQKRAQAQQQFQDQQASQTQNREQTLMNAQLANMHSEMAARQHTSDLQDKSASDKHNAASAALVTNLTAAGATPAMISVDGKGASEFPATDLAAAYVKDPTILQAPKGYVRTFVDTTDSTGMTFNGHQWVNSAGEPVNMTDHTNVKAFDTPIDSMNTKVSTSNKDVNAAYGSNLLPADGSSMVSPVDLINLNTKRMAADKEQASTRLEAHRAATADAELGLRQRELNDKEKASGLDSNGAVSPIAQNIADGHISPDRLGYLLAKNPDLLSGVMKADPTFDSAKASAYPKVYQDFTSTKNGSAGGTLVAAGTAFKHLQELQELNTYESRIPGTADYQKYENKLATVAPELAKVYNDSTIPGIEGYKKTLGAFANRDAAIVTQAQSMGDKVDALNQTWTNAAPSARYEAPLPGMDAHANAARAALDPRYKQATSPQNGQQPQFSHVSASGKFGWDGAKWVPVAGK